MGAIVIRCAGPAKQTPLVGMYRRAWLAPCLTAWPVGLVDEHVGDGSLDEAAIPALAARIRAEGIEALAISFLHSYVDPSHEQRARALLGQHLPELAISISSEVCREIREYERTSTVVANAYVLPLMRTYVARMQDGLRALGAACPLLLTKIGRAHV